MNEDIERVLFTEDQINQRLDELAATLTKDYQDKCPVLVSVMTGAMIFSCDLMRRLDFKLNVDYVDVSSYASGSKSSGEVRLIQDLSYGIRGRDVLIIEDIIDSGHTLEYLDKLFAQRGANSIKICAFLDKPDRREIDVDADYVGYEVPNEFIVGYGLDYNGLYRNLPYLGILKRSVYEN